MSKLRGRILGAGLLALALALPAQAQDTFRLQSAGGTTAFGYYVGPYYAQELVGGVFSSPFKVYCVDFTHDIYVGQSWTAYVTSLGSDLAATRLGNVGLQQYREAAWLATQFALVAPSGWGDIHATIWQIMNPGAAGEPVPSSNYWLTQATTHYMDNGAGFYDSFAVLTPTNKLEPASAQEFLTTSIPVSATPEPEEEILLGFGLMTIGLLFWWRRHASVA